jgi:hypothetical protein
MLLTAVTEVTVVAFNVPLLTHSLRKIVTQQAVIGRPRTKRVRVGGSDEACEVVANAIAIYGVRPVNTVNINCIVKPKEAVNVS